MSSGMPSGIVCTPEELALSQSSPSELYCLTRGQSIGLTLTAEAGFVSLISVLILFILIIRNVVRYQRIAPGGTWRLLARPLDIYMFSLFWSDLIQALGTVLDVKWINDGKVSVGTFCSAQGAIQQLGETAVSMTTFVIAVHTFITAVWRKGVHSRFVAFCIVGFIWLFVILFVSIGVGLHARGSHRWDTPTPYWCWIGPRWKVSRIFGEYLWLWITLGTSLLVYIPLFMWSGGILSVDDHRWWRFRLHPRRQAHDFEVRRRLMFSILAYPISYSILVLPLSIVRWITFSTGSVPSSGTFIVITLYSLSGMVNVLLLLLTRPRLLLFSEPQPPITPALPPPPPKPARKAVPQFMKGDRPGTAESQQPMQMERLDDDGRWDLPSEGGSIASLYNSSPNTH